MGMTSKGGIKSIQRGVISLADTVATNTATITSVDTTKSELRKLGNSYIGGAPSTAEANIVLTNATTITATRGATSQVTNVSWELTEFY